ncbi:16S rRNA (cytosine(1402)-N(4))-methyltransferase RsmH [Hoyosella subflava]|uniref:Ribosomal RNA small subunit methyltransferase H n=1 Tax=Hoyosella subflava (strain DSM 45089 / JCM 17490 / NBRC 109087 / DQS3-9A1) TaxID=443218 RepID=F6EFF8_HOYSD|nr:16S rRNA (cytosine(1402)-N(4))-methyltransferase RsmH [Hoyosella subflava]AEF39771.1 Ribosomal RNA small subunit methyltransferase H [Hoyosella subflava DQS3-9A1]
MTDEMPGRPSEGQPKHVPVMADRAVELFTPAITQRAADGTGAVLVDATLGLGGHAERFLRDFPGLRVVGLDRDQRALSLSRERLAAFGDRVTFVHTRFDGIVTALDQAGLAQSEAVDAILFDLGVSSMQLDEKGRGFAYSIDAPLDMRMDTTTDLTAADVLNTYSRGQLARVLSVYGEERFAGRIASAIVRYREQQPFTTSAPLVELLYGAIPAAARRTGGHPAKRTFQALRIEVNGELDALEKVIEPACAALAVGGRVAFMSYQSLEDRIVKRELAQRVKSRSPEGLPVDLPGTGPEFRLLTRGAERASETEAATNPRSAPVRLRAAERIARRSQ